MRPRPMYLMLTISSLFLPLGGVCPAGIPVLADLNGDLRVDSRDQMILMREWYSQSGANPVVSLADPAFELAARGILQNPASVIHARDLANIESLRLPLSLDLNALMDLEHFPSLKHFSVSSPRPNDSSLDLAPLAFLHQIRTLELTRVGGTVQTTVDATPIGSLITLTNLVLAGNALTNASVLANLTNLIELVVSNSQTPDISFVSSLEHLLSLDLHGNEIVDISPLQSLMNLRVLSIGSNAIVNISSLTNLENLEVVSLECNEITNIQPLVDNPGIGAGDLVILSGNPLDDTSVNTHIPALQARGVEVKFVTRVFCISLPKEE